MYGARIPPTRAQRELAPMPEFRTTVGKISEEKMQRVAKAPAIPSLPIMAKATPVHCRAAKQQHTTRLDIVHSGNERYQPSARFQTDCWQGSERASSEHAIWDLSPSTPTTFHKMFLLLFYFLFIRLIPFII